MAHEIEIDNNGKAAAFFVGEPAWHRLGKVFPEGTDLDVPTAIEAAGLNWQVRLQPLHMTYDGENLPVPGYATVRDSDRSVLGVVGPTYRPLQNRDAFAWFQPFLDAGEATLEAAGSLRGGKRVWVLARLNRDPIEVVPGDEVRKYVLLSNGHDGTLAIRAGFSPIRVVCANTMAQAHNDAGSKLLRIRHTARAVKTLEEVREIMNLADREFMASAEQYKALARHGVSVEDLKAYVRKVFAPKVTLTEPEEENERLLGKIIPLFEQGRGNNLPGVRGTAWAAYNAVNEYLGYERGRSDDGRLDSLWFGDSARLNEKALTTALRMVA
jgi:phage/plasmid-like protein (TIGR03299 family)